MPEAPELMPPSAPGASLTDLLLSVPFLVNALAVYAVADALKRLAAGRLPAAQRERAKTALTVLTLLLGAVGGVLLEHTGDVAQDALLGLVAGSSSASVHAMVKRLVPGLASSLEGK